MPTWELPASNFDAPPGQADGGANALATAITRDATYFGKFGLGYRKESSDYSITCGGIYTATPLGLYTDHCLAAVYRVAWMFRIRAFPSSEEAIIAFSSAVNPQYAGYITVDAGGTVRMYSSGAAPAVDIAAANGQTAPVIVVDTWYAMEFYIDWAENTSGGGVPPAAPAVVTLGIAEPGNTPSTISIDPTMGVVLADAGLGKGNGSGAGMTYLTALFIMPTGPVPGPPATSGQYDFDGFTILQYDQEPVVHIPFSDLSGYTLNANLHAILSPVVALTALPIEQVISAGAWLMNNGAALDARAVGEYGALSQVLTGGMKSSTANDPVVLRYTMPLTVLPSGPRSAAIGVSFFTASYAGGNTASISVNGSTPVAIAMTANVWREVWLRGQVGAGVGVLDVTFTHPNDAAPAVVQNIVVQVVGQPAAPLTGVSVKVATGTYVGNDTAQSIDIGAASGGGAGTFRPHWIFLSKDSASGKGIAWWDSMLFPEDWSKSTVRSAEITPTLIGFDVIGPAAQTNASGVTYRWYAIEDDLRRCLFYGAAGVTSGTTFTLGTPLTAYNCPPATFVSRALWLHDEAYNAASSANGGYFRGSGHTGQNSSPLDAAQVTNAIRSLPGATWEAGTRITQNQPQFSFTCWATDFAHTKLWAVTSYTGDGTNPRNVFVDLGGGTPGWCLVVPHNDLAWVRVFSMPLNTSQQMDGGTSGTDEIRAFAPDQITVGGTLNTNGVIYEVLAIINPPGGEIEDTPGDVPCVLSFPLGADSGGGSGCQVGL